jgi:hypothetical protein
MKKLLILIIIPILISCNTNRSEIYESNNDRVKWEKIEAANSYDVYIMKLDGMEYIVINTGSGITITDKQ